MPRSSATVEGRGRLLDGTSAVIGLSLSTLDYSAPLAALVDNPVPPDESDIASIDGLRCTTALRTVIDLAPELEVAELKRIVRTCLDRGLFTPE